LPEVRLDGVICIVDAYATVKFPHLGRVTRTQLEIADILLLNKMDLIEAHHIETVKQQMRQINDRAVVFQTIRCDIDPNRLFGLEVERQTIPTEHHHDVEFQSFTFTTEKRLDRQRFEVVAAGWPESVYRAKGFVRFLDGSHLFSYVVGRWDLEDLDAGKTELVFIGRDLAKDKEAILGRLRECEI